MLTSYVCDVSAHNTKQTIGPFCFIAFIFLVWPQYQMRRHGKERNESFIAAAALAITFLELTLSSVSTTICQTFEARRRLAISMCALAN